MTRISRVGYGYHIYLSQVILLILVDRPFKHTKTKIPVANPEHILYMKSGNVKH